MVLAEWDRSEQRVASSSCSESREYKRFIRPEVLKRLTDIAPEHRASVRMRKEGLPPLT